MTSFVSMLVLATFNRSSLEVGSTFSAIFSRISLGLLGGSGVAFHYHHWVDFLGDQVLRLLKKRPGYDRPPKLSRLRPRCRLPC